MNFKYLLILGVVVITSACGDQKKKGKASYAKVDMTNGTSLTLADDTYLDGVLTKYTPTKYAIKLLSMYIVPDVDANSNNVGQPSMIWINPDCKTAEQETEVDGKLYSYNSASDCADDKVTTFIELAQPAAAVNTQLNSQGLLVLPGTYYYVRMDICVGGPLSANVKFLADGMTDVFSATNGTCGITSVKAAAPITVADGESVTVSLSYNLKDTIYYYAGSTTPSPYCYMNSEKTMQRCSNFPALTPSVVK